MNREQRFYPLAWPFLVGLLALLAGLVVLVQVGVLRYVYARLGVPPRYVFAVLLLELLGSSLNIPVARFRTAASAGIRRVVVFGVVYVVPVVREPRVTILAVNVGGAVIPSALAVYLTVHTGDWLDALLCTAIVTVAVNMMARPVPGLGIAVPTLLPGVVAAAAAALVTSTHHAPPAAFTAGTLGTLIGADVMNIPKIRSLGAPVASIGGAGTFDAVFVTGIVAVLLVTL